MEKSDILGGGNFIHDPINPDTDPKYDIVVVGMETNFIIYIHFYHFFFAIKFTYHDVQTRKLNLITMGASKST